MMRLALALLVTLFAGYCITWAISVDYWFYAGYTVLQFAALAVAWNILGGYAGYVNFGAAGFVGIGAYTTVFLQKWLDLPLLAAIPSAALVAGLLGCLMGLITLRLRGMYFAIGTLALTVLLETVVTNWSFVGGARGAYLIPPFVVAGFASWIKFLFVLMLALLLIAIAVAAWVEQSPLGRGLRALKDSEPAAEACGVPTLRLKIIAMGISSALMGAVGAPLPWYLTFIEPHTAFGMNFSISAVAMAMIGGPMHWSGPLLGAVLVGITHQATTVTFGSASGVLVLGLSLMVFVVAVPRGILGLLPRWRSK